MINKYEEDFIKIINVKSSDNIFVKINLNKELISETKKPKLTTEII